MVSKNAVAYAILATVLMGSQAFAQIGDIGNGNIGIVNGNLNALLSPLAPVPLLELPGFTNGLANGLNNQTILNGTLLNGTLLNGTIPNGTDIGMLNGTGIGTGNNNGNNNVGMNLGNGLNGNGLGNNNR
jgi:hypothetical protein